MNFVILRIKNSDKSQLYFFVFSNRYLETLGPVSYTHLTLPTTPYV